MTAPTSTPTSTVTNKRRSPIHVHKSSQEKTQSAWREGAPELRPGSLGLLGGGQPVYIDTEGDRHRVTPSVQLTDMGTPLHAQMHPQHTQIEMKDTQDQDQKHNPTCTTHSHTQKQSPPWPPSNSHTLTGTHPYQAGQALALLSHPTGSLGHREREPRGPPS